MLFLTLLFNDLLPSGETSILLFYSVYVVEGIQTPIACLDTPAWTTRPGDPGGGLNTG